LNPRFNGSVNLYADLIQRERTLQHPEYPLFKTVFPGWDNSARRVGRGKIFHQSTPDLFSEWLDLVCRQTMDTLSSNDEKLVFINAWNEWAEGAHLEPDRRFGYAYLEATAKILNKYAA
jgi:lipopolysaccharide biosynthesis protein